MSTWVCPRHDRLNLYGECEEMNLNIDYQYAIDWGHCEDITQARERLSAITQILNKVIMVRQYAKKEILLLCARYPKEKFSKMSWDNKMVRLAEIFEKGKDIVSLWQDADSAYRQLRSKHEVIIEDLLALKKIMEVTPR
jgi:hypothetical protein